MEKDEEEEDDDDEDEDEDGAGGDTTTALASAAAASRHKAEIMRKMIEDGGAHDAPAKKKKKKKKPKRKSKGAIDGATAAASAAASAAAAAAAAAADEAAFVASFFRKKKKPKAAVKKHTGPHKAKKRRRIGKKLRAILDDIEEMTTRNRLCASIKANDAAFTEVAISLVTGVHVKALAGAMAGNRHTTKLDISGFLAIGDESGRELADKLYENTTLTALVLGEALEEDPAWVVKWRAKTNRPPSGIAAPIRARIVARVERNALIRRIADDDASLREVDLKQLSDRHGAPLASALASNRMLTWLALTDNALEPSSVRAVADAIGGNEALRPTLAVAEPRVATWVAIRRVAHDDAVAEVDLARRGLSDAHAHELASAIAGNTHVRSLNIAGNPFGDACARAIGEALGEEAALRHAATVDDTRASMWLLAKRLAHDDDKTLETVVFEQNAMGEGQLRAIAAALGGNAHCVHLKLPGVDTLGGEAVARFEAAMRTNETLRRLDVDAGTRAREALAQTLRAVHRNNVICLLRERGKNKESEARFVEGVVADPTMEELDLRASFVTDAHAGRLAEALKVSEKGLRADGGGAKKGLGGRAKMRASAKRMRLPRKVRTLRLADNELSDAGARQLAETAFSMPESALVTVGLSGNRIGEAGAAAIATMLERHTTLVAVELAGNADVDAASLAAIAALTARNESINRVARNDPALGELDLSGACVTNRHALLLAKALEGNTALTSLNLDATATAATSKAAADGAAASSAGHARNSIGELDQAARGKGSTRKLKSQQDGVVALFNVLKKNETLAHLNLVGPPITASRSKALRDALRENVKLSILKRSPPPAPWPKKKEKGAKAGLKELEQEVVAMLHRNEQIAQVYLGQATALDFSNRFMSDKHLAEVKQALAGNTTVTKFTLTGNTFLKRNKKKKQKQSKVQKKGAKANKTPEARIAKMLFGIFSDNERISDFVVEWPVKKGKHTRFAEEEIVTTLLKIERNEPSLTSWNLQDKHKLNHPKAFTFKDALLKRFAAALTKNTCLTSFSFETFVSKRKSKKGSKTAKKPKKEKATKEGARAICKVLEEEKNTTLLEIDWATLEKPCFGDAAEIKAKIDRCLVDNSISDIKRDSNRTRVALHGETMTRTQYQNLIAALKVNTHLQFLALQPDNDDGGGRESRRGGRSSRASSSRGGSSRSRGKGRGKGSSRSGRKGGNFFGAEFEDPDAAVPAILLRHAPALAQAICENAALVGNGLGVDVDAVGSVTACAVALKKMANEDPNVKDSVKVLDLSRTAALEPAFRAKLIKDGLSLAARSNSVEVVSFSGCGLADADVVPLFNVSIEELDLSHNSIELIKLEGKKSVTKALKKNTSMKKLNLAHNKLEDKAGHKLWKAFCWHNSTLSYIDLTGNPLDRFWPDAEEGRSSHISGSSSRRSKKGEKHKNYEKNFAHCVEQLVSDSSRNHGDNFKCAMLREIEREKRVSKTGKTKGKSPRHSKKKSGWE